MGSFSVLQVHFHCDRYDVTHLPSDQADAVKWLNEKWAAKESRLKAYHNSSDKRFSLREHQRRWPVEPTSRERIGLVVSFLFWTLTSSMWIYFFVALTEMRVYFVTAIIVFVAFEYTYGGVERWAVHVFKQRSAKTVKYFDKN